MYADDTTVFVSDLNSIGHLLDMLEKFASTSGLQFTVYSFRFTVYSQYGLQSIRQKPKLCGWLILIGHKNLFAR